MKTPDNCIQLTKDTYAVPAIQALAGCTTGRLPENGIGSVLVHGLGVEHVCIDWADPKHNNGYLLKMKNGYANFLAACVADDRMTELLDPHKKDWTHAERCEWDMHLYSHAATGLYVNLSGPSHYRLNHGRSQVDIVLTDPNNRSSACSEIAPAAGAWAQAAEHYFLNGFSGKLKSPHTHYIINGKLSSSRTFHHEFVISEATGRILDGTMGYALAPEPKFDIQQPGAVFAAFRSGKNIQFVGHTASGDTVHEGYNLGEPALTANAPASLAASPAQTAPAHDERLAVINGVQNQSAAINPINRADKAKEQHGESMKKAIHAAERAKPSFHEAPIPSFSTHHHVTGNLPPSANAINSLVKNNLAKNSTSR